MKTQPNHQTQSGVRCPTLRHVLALCLLPLIAAAVGAGCKPEPKATAGLDPVGTYVLVSIDGNKVPCTIKHGEAALNIKSGTFAIQADGTCSSKMAFSVESRGDADREVKATYTRQGSQLTMKWEGAGTTVGTVEGTTFTMNNEGMVLVYTKQ